MANKDGHRRFGNVRKRESGRYQVRYPGPDGRMRSAPKTFATKTDADRYLTLIEAQIINGDWTDPDRAKVKLGDYAAKWIEQRPGLRPRTVELYVRLLRNHIAPHLGNVQLGNLSTPMIRDWRMELLRNGVSASVTAKAYRLLRAVLMTASEEDRIIPRNPCRLRGAGDEHPEERPVLSLAQVFELAELLGRHPIGNVRAVSGGKYRLRYKLADGEMRTFPQNFPSRDAAERVLWSMALDGHAAVKHDESFRALVLLATFASLRWGEAVALRRRDVDMKAGTVTVRRQYLEMDTGDMVVGPTKSRAGARTVSLPAAILSAIATHMEGHTGSDPAALVFTGAKGGVLRRGNFRRASRWADAVAAVGVPGLHFHDLRHTGNTLAAQSGASLRDLMDRMGHDSVRAAMIYQHGTSEAGKAIADALSDRITAARAAEDDDGDDGAAGTLVPVA
ncbi:tyrosine-type recombinase/integrase [Actinomadura welshii]|uniref:tyrosine-type recombinase/integrase n=1 Tax=Actinomadura welshii TaxID=3103817 RepID=UPI0004099EFA|nr:site-specific integrase [Actinomadura madurae]